MTEKTPGSRSGDATQAALAAANQALAAANAAVEAAARALALSAGNEQEARPNRAARRAANAIRRAGSKAAPPEPGLVEAGPAAPPAPPVEPVAELELPALEPAEEPAADLEVAAPEPAEEPLEFPPAQLPTEAGDLVPGHDRPGRLPVDLDTAPQAETTAQGREPGAGPIILGPAAGPDAPPAPAAAAPTPEAEPRRDAAAAARVIRQEAEQRDREIELAQREAAMARFSPMEPARRVAAVPQAEPNGYTVLVVDDEEQVRALTVRILSRYGYDVLQASGVELALELLDSHGRDVNLVLSDVAMPGLSGKDLFRAISRTRPGLPVVFMSGYALGVYAPEGLVEEGVKMLPKPFSQDDLLAFVTEALAGAAAR